MELLIIFVVISFLIGTIGFALPSKSSKKISELRLNASRLGLKIVPSNIGKNSFKNKDVNLMIYSLKNETNLKEAHFIRDKDELILYSPLKLKYSDGAEEKTFGQSLKTLSKKVWFTPMKDVSKRKEILEHFGFSVSMLARESTG